MSTVAYRNLERRPRRRLSSPRIDAIRQEAAQVPGQRSRHRGRGRRTPRVKAGRRSVFHADDVASRVRRRMFIDKATRCAISEASVVRF